MDQQLRKKKKIEIDIAGLHTGGSRKDGREKLE